MVGTARGVADRLGALPIEQVAREALHAAAERMAESVRAALSTPAPERTASSGTEAFQHDTPWLRTGALRESISVVADGDTVRVFSADPAARAQELGTARTPPRPFLGPVAAGEGATIAEAVSRAVMELLR